MSRVHFITYGDAVFKNSVDRIKKEAVEFGEFKTVKAYSPEDLTEPFKLKYKSILSMPRGGGYWIWRPVIVRDAFDKIETGDYLVYLDAGCTILTSGIKRFKEYLKILDDSETEILSFQMNGITGLCSENEWTIKEIFEYFNTDPNDSSGQFLGGIFILKKGKKSERYLSEYEQAVFERPDLCTDDYNSNGRQPHSFKENRHEQSVTSVLRKKLGTAVIPTDESFLFALIGPEKAKEYPFWATRKRF